jgi:hypothetical protein
MKISAMEKNGEKGEYKILEEGMLQFSDTF